MSLKKILPMGDMETMTDHDGTAVLFSSTELFQACCAVFKDTSSVN